MEKQIRTKKEREHGYIEYIISGVLSDEDFEKYKKEQKTVKDIVRVNSHTMKVQPFKSPCDYDDLGPLMTEELRKILKLKKNKIIRFTRIAYNLYELRRI